MEASILKQAEWQDRGGVIVNSAPHSYQGFVYMITHNDGRYYIGKKNYWTYRKLKRGRKKVESDWKNYWGSSVALQKALEKENYKYWKRTILINCQSKNEMSYNEIRLQIQNDVLNDEKSYNRFISCRIKSNKPQIID